jgi:hypothetical protein
VYTGITIDDVIRPRYLIVPVTLEGLSNQLMNSRTSVGQANPQVASRVQGLAQIVSEARLDNASLTAWYLAASASDTDTIEVAYLNGQQTPTMTEEEGFDTVEANLKLGFKMDERDYGVGAQIIRDQGVSHLRLMTNNPTKRAGLIGYGLEIVENVSLVIPSNPHNAKYLATKRDKMGHSI